MPRRPQPKTALIAPKARFTQSGSEVYRLRTSDFGLADLTPAATVASLIYVLYPTIKMLQ